MRGAAFKVQRFRGSEVQRFRVRVTTVAFAEAEGRHVASIDIAVFVGGRSQRQVGEVRKRVDLKLEPATYARLRQDGVSFSATIDLTAAPRDVKAVVYDYAADRLGSAVAEVR